MKLTKIDYEFWNYSLLWGVARYLDDPDNTVADIPFNSNGPFGKYVAYITVFRIMFLVIWLSQFDKL